MTVLWLIVAFVAGAIVWNKTQLFILKRVLRRADKTMADTLSSLPQKSLLSIAEKAQAEIAFRASSGADKAATSPAVPAASDDRRVAPDA